ARVQSFDTRVAPDDPKLVGAIERLLQARLTRSKSMRKLALALCLAFGFAFACTPSIAQDKKEAKKEPTAAQKKQQERMKDCNEQAGAKKMEGDARKKFMSTCLKGGSAKGEMTPQQARMKD